MKLQNKTILITGASSGIGKAMALLCAKDGATIILAARSKDKLEAVKSEVEKLGGMGIVVPTDVTRPDQVRQLFLEATKDGRVLDAVYNNAGLGYVAKIQDLTIEQIKEVVDVNIFGMMIVAKFAAEIMSRQNYGHIMFVSSLAGLITLPQWSVYVGSKWGITAFADCIRMDLKPNNVKITTIHPGAVVTDFWDKDKADIDISNLSGGAVPAEEVARKSYEALFTNKTRVLIPSATKMYASFYKYFPGLVHMMMEKMIKDVKYHVNEAEDEPEFDYVPTITE